MIDAMEYGSYISLVIIFSALARLSLVLRKTVKIIYVYSLGQLVLCRAWHHLVSHNM